METFTVYYDRGNTAWVEALYAKLDCTGEPFHSLFDNDSTGGSYDQFTIISTYNPTAYRTIHALLKRGILTGYRA